MPINHFQPNNFRWQTGQNLAQSFASWEERGRGWEIWDFPVNLEPRFSLFQPQPIQPQNLLDNGRVPSRFGRIFGNQNETVTGNLLSVACENEVIQVNPPKRRDDEQRTSFRLIFPKELKLLHLQMTQFLRNLAHSATWISWEIIGTKDEIVWQIVCPERESNSVISQMETHFPNIRFEQGDDLLACNFSQNRIQQTVTVDFGLGKEWFLPLTDSKQNLDYLLPLIASLEAVINQEAVCLQIIFERTRHLWQEAIREAIQSLSINNKNNPYLQLLTNSNEKLSQPLLAVALRLVVQSENQERSWQIARNVGTFLKQFSNPNGNELIPLRADNFFTQRHLDNILRRISNRSGMLLGTSESAALMQFPNEAIISKKIKRDEKRSKAVTSLALSHSLILGKNNHQGKIQEVSLSNEQRTKHLHLIGSSGSGKSTLLINLIKQDLDNKQGLCVIDPHGDLIDEVISNVPNERLNDVILFDPSDEQFPIGFNILQANSELEKNLLSSDLVATFRRMATSWGDVMDSVLANAILAFVESTKGGTLFDLRRFLVEKDFRADFLKTVDDNSVRYFWGQEFPHLTGKPQSSILIRLDSFLRNKMIRNIVCQKQTNLDFRKIMDEKKILLIKLSQGLIGEENAHLLGTLLVSKIYQTALSRQDSSNRPYFWLYLDEFQHFITPSMESILSGIRKFNIGLHLAHQEFRQLQSRSQEVASSVLSNCYTRICFRLGDTDAEKFTSGFSFFDSKALQNLGIGEAIARVERAEFDFNLKTKLITKVDKEIAQHRKQAILQNTRENFAKPKAEVERSLFEGLEKEKIEPIKVISEIEEESQTKVKNQSPKAKDHISNVETDNSHRYLQSIIKRVGESNGFVATLEKQVFGGIGKVDVALENEQFKVACEVAVTNTVEYELQNIQKCLASGFDKVVVVSSDTKHLFNIKRKAEEMISAKQMQKVTFLEPEHFHLFLEKLNAESQLINQEIKVKGYKVKVSFKESSRSEQTAKEKTILEILKNAENRK